MRLLTRLGLALAVSGLATAGATAQSGRFPHARHARLFLSCTSCHAGVTSGDAAKVFPSPSDCARCHNDRDQKRVTWTGPAPRVTNLRFSHIGHLAKSSEAGEAVQCTRCHATETDTSWMRVRGASAAGCVTCHAHSAPEHLAETAICGTCHNTLADSRALTVARIAAFPKPPSHAKPGFASSHAPSGAGGAGSAGSAAQCATCHARESCTRCHVNASRVPAIAQLAPDARVAELTRGRAAVYPTPASHTAPGFATSHGSLATSAPQTCANCHAQASCRSCHIGSKTPAVIASLPNPEPGGAAGVSLTRVTVHAAGFLAQHKTSAAAGRLDCAGCHQQRECSSCHEGASSRRYHPTDFMSRHAPAAYAQDQNCSTCHRTETFCRSCHLDNNMTVSGARTGAAHTGQPQWLLQHGEAARRGLTGCTTCHQQRDCLRCHSSLGLKVNPHGPDFDASRVSARNKQMCATCHVTDPLASPP